MTIESDARGGETGLVWPTARLRNRDCNEGHFDLAGSACKALRAAGAPREVVARFLAETRQGLGRSGTHDVIRRWMQVDVWLDRWMTRDDDEVDAWIAAHLRPAGTEAGR